MITFGVILIVIGLLVPKLAVLFTIGIVIAVIGLALILLGAVGHPVGGRRYWY